MRDKGMGKKWIYLRETCFTDRVWAVLEDRKPRNMGCQFLWAG